jgi:hypothetical protein
MGFGAGVWAVSAAIFTVFSGVVAGLETGLETGLEIGGVTGVAIGGDVDTAAPDPDPGPGSGSDSTALESNVGNSVSGATTGSVVGGCSCSGVASMGAKTLAEFYGRGQVGHCWLKQFPTDSLRPIGIHSEAAVRWGCAVQLFEAAVQSSCSMQLFNAARCSSIQLFSTPLSEASD